MMSASEANEMESTQAIKKMVRERYGSIAKERSSCCGPQPAASCCGSLQVDRLEKGKQIGYSSDEMESVPEGANMSLGCGNPTALASLVEGETVLDLGSGGGFDCFLAAGKVGEKGKVIGVDMTHEMIELARSNARKGNYGNVEFRLGELEHLPAGDNTVDCIISNCVVNLVPDKDQVFRECHRVLKPGGRMMISDIVLNRELPEDIKNDIKAYTGCIAGASWKSDYLQKMKNAGFTEAVIVEERIFGRRKDVPPEKQALYDRLSDTIVSANVKAIK
jgi:SAM-dependent methyltransferase